MTKTVDDICSLFIQKTNFDIDINQFVAENNKFECFNSDIKTYSNPFISTDITTNIKTQQIVQELTNALNKNSVTEIKILKRKYENSQDFAQAKKILNTKCKELWNVYEAKNCPKEAMKALGISNQPDLDTILGNSVRYFEKDNKDTTSYIISSILNNKNMTYTIEDIHNYLIKMHQKEQCHYNLKTVEYLINKQNYTAEQLKSLGITFKEIKQVSKSLPIKKQINFLLKELEQKFNQK